MRCAILLLFTAAGMAAQPASVEGRVTDAATGRPVRNAEVLLRGLTRSGTPPDTDNYVAETDGNGRFAIRDIAPGKYQATASHAGYLSRVPGRPLEPGTLATITLSAVQHATLALKLLATGIISGRVLNVNGEAVSGAVIESLEEAYAGNDSVEPGTVWWGLPAGGRRQLEVRSRAASDDRGEYRFFGLAPGRYYLRITASTGDDMYRMVMSGGMPQHTVQTFGTTYYPAARSPREAAPLDVTAGGELRNVEIRVRQELPHAIRGIVPAPHTPEFSFTLQPQGDRSSPTPFSDYSTSDEIFSFGGVMPGTYVVSTTIRDPAHPEQKLFERQTVEVVDRDVEGVTLHRTPMKTVTGTVSANGAMRFGNMNVELDPDNPDSPTVATKVAADGTFTVEVLPESYRLTRPRITTAYVKSVKMGTRDVPDFQIDFASMEGPLQIVLGTDGGKVEGLVKDAEGKPAPYTRVMLAPAGAQQAWSGRVRFTNTDEDGRFEINVVAPGEYKIFSWLDADLSAPLNPEFRKKYDELGVGVVMDPKGSKVVELRAIVTK